MNKKFALLIGNSIFDDNETFKPLGTPENDVAGFASALKDYGGFEIVGILTNQSSEKVKSAIEDFYNRAERGDLTLLYFSAHGYRSANGRLYITAKNTSVDKLITSGIGENFLKEAMQATNCRHRVVIFDCCFSGAFVANAKAGDEAINFEFLSGEADAVMASSGKNQPSFEDKDGKYSLFTKYLIEGIVTGQADQNKDGDIDLEELFNYSAQHLKLERPSQTPILSLQRRDSRIVIAKGYDLSSACTLLTCNATPEDDYIAAWLSAKLSLQGYETASINELNPEHSLDSVLGREVRKVLYILTGASRNKQTLVDSIKIAKGYQNRENFILYLLFENIDPAEVQNLAEGAKVINFFQNWASGLRELVNCLGQDQIPTHGNAESGDIISQWGKRLSLHNRIVFNSRENYFSNWFPLTLPRYLYIHHISTYDDVKASDSSIPVVWDKNYLLTFACQDCCQSFARINRTQRVQIKDFLDGREFIAKDGTSFKDSNKKIIQLLNRAFYFLLRDKGLQEYQLSDSSIFYFEEMSNGQRKSVVVKLNGLGRRSVNLSGKFRKNLWHFAIEANAFIYPVPAYFLAYHAVFKSQDGHLLSKKTQHELRRSIGKDWYNPELCSLTFGAITWLLGNATNIDIKVDCKQSVVIDPHSISFISKVGYLNPRGTSRE